MRGSLFVLISEAKCEEMDATSASAMQLSLFQWNFEEWCIEGDF